MDSISGENLISIWIREGQKLENTAFQISVHPRSYNIEGGRWLLLEKKRNTNMIWKRLQFDRSSFWLHGRLQDGTVVEETRIQIRKGIGDAAYDLFGTILNQVWGIDCGSQWGIQVIHRGSSGRQTGWSPLFKEKMSRPSQEEPQFRKKKFSPLDIGIKSLEYKIGFHKVGAKSQGSVILTMSKVANSSLIWSSL